MNIISPVKTVRELQAELTKGLQHAKELLDEGITSEEDYAAEIEELRSKFNRSVRDEHRRKVDLDQKRQQPRPQLGEEESRVSKRVQDARLRLQSQKAALLRRLQTVQVQWTMQTKPGDDSTRPPATQASTSADRGAPAFTQHIRAKFEDLRSELRSRKADVCRNVDGRSQRLISQIEMNRQSAEIFVEKLQRIITRGAALGHSCGLLQHDQRASCEDGAGDASCKAEMESACDDASCKAGKESNCDAVRHRRRVGAASQGRACLHQQQADLTLGSQGLQKSDGHDCEDDAALLHEHVGTFAPLALEKLLQEMDALLSAPDAEVLAMPPQLMSRQMLFPALHIAQATESVSSLELTRIPLPHGLVATQASTAQAAQAAAASTPQAAATRSATSAWASVDLPREAPHVTAAALPFHVRGGSCYPSDIDIDIDQLLSDGGAGTGEGWFGGAGERATRGSDRDLAGDVDADFDELLREMGCVCEEPHPTRHLPGKSVTNEPEPPRQANAGLDTGHLLCVLSPPPSKRKGPGVAGEDASCVVQDAYRGERDGRSNAEDLIDFSPQRS